MQPIHPNSILQLQQIFFCKSCYLRCWCLSVQFTITQNIPGGSKLDRNMVNHSVAALIRKCLSHKVNANGSYWWNCFATKNFAPCSTNINDNDKRKGVIDIFNQTKHILNNMTGWSVLKLFPKLFCCKKCFFIIHRRSYQMGVNCLTFWFTLRAVSFHAMRTIDWLCAKWIICCVTGSDICGGPTFSITYRFAVSVGHSIMEDRHNLRG